MARLHAIAIGDHRVACGAATGLRAPRRLLKAVSVDPSELASAVLADLQPRPTERFVLSYLAHAGELHYAALVLGPARMSSMSWADWQKHHDLVVHLDHGGVPAAFSIAHEGWSAGRTSLTRPRASLALGHPCGTGVGRKWSSRPQGRGWGP